MAMPNQPDIRAFTLFKQPTVLPAEYMINLILGPFPRWHLHSATLIYVLKANFTVYQVSHIDIINQCL